MVIIRNLHNKLFYEPIHFYREYFVNPLESVYIDLFYLKQAILWKHAILGVFHENPYNEYTLVLVVAFCKMSPLKKDGFMKQPALNEYRSIYTNFRRKFWDGFGMLAMIIKSKRETETALCLITQYTLGVRPIIMEKLRVYTRSIPTWTRIIVHFFDKNCFALVRYRQMKYMKSFAVICLCHVLQASFLYVCQIL